MNFSVGVSGRIRPETITQDLQTIILRLRTEVLLFSMDVLSLKLCVKIKERIDRVVAKLAMIVNTVMTVNHDIIFSPGPF